MISAWFPLLRFGSLCLACVVGLSVALSASQAHSETCSLPSLYAGVAFPVELVEAGWACRLQPIISHYTTANKLGPVRTPLSESVYLHFLDRPLMTVSLINRLGIAPYQSESRGLVRYWGNDGEGTEGIVELVYQDRTSRIYYLEGSHHSRLLPDIAGKAVVLLRMNQVTDSNGTAAMESTFVYYTRLDNRLLSGLLSLFRPLVGSTVTKKMVKGVDSVNRLSLAMQQQPDRILSEAAKPPAFTVDEMAFLQQTVEYWSHPIGTVPAKTVAP